MASRLVGNMSMHGVTKSISIPLQFLGSGPGPAGGQRAGFLANFTLQRSDFGMSNMLPAIGDDITVMMSFEGSPAIVIGPLELALCRAGSR